MDTGKIERAAVRAVEEYIDSFPNMTPDIHQNDKTPIWDGDIFLYDNEEAKAVKNFVSRVPLQVKGTTDDKDYFYIEPEYIKGFKADRGCIFFVVNVAKDSLKPQKVLYAMLSSELLDQLLQKSTKTCRIDLKEVPVDYKIFEMKLFAFSAKRNGENVENYSQKEIASLVEGFELIREYLGEIKDKGVYLELKTSLDIIKNPTDDATVGWRDKFIYYSRKALFLAINNLRDHDFTVLQFNFGTYLHKQKLFHLVEDYYLEALVELRNRAEVCPVPPYKNYVANALNSLAVLHKSFTRYNEAEQELQEALRIRRELAVINSDAYIEDIAKTLNNLGELHRVLSRFYEAEKEYQEAKNIFKDLARTNHDVYIGDFATTLNNLAVLYLDLTRYDEAEQECQEALKIRRELAKTNRDANIAVLADTLNNIAIMHKNLSRFEEALREYEEALEIYRELAKTNHNAFIEYVAQTLNNLAVLHTDLNCYEDAEKEYKEALEIRQALAKINHDVYIEYVATTLNNLGNLHTKISRYEEAEEEYKEALKYYTELAEVNYDAYIQYVAMVLSNLAQLLKKDVNRLEEARVAANESLCIFKELANKYPHIWGNVVVNTQRLLDIIVRAIKPRA